MIDIDEGAGSRDLFWRRAAAGAVDILGMVLVATLAGLVLYGASGGQLRSSTFFKTTRCQPLGAISTKVLQGVAVPPDARPVAAQLCTTSLAGLEASRYASVMLQAQDGEVVRSMAFSRPVDRKGEPLTPVILDWLYPLAFIAILAFCEGLLGATLGKLAFGLRVTGPSGERLGLPRALLRNGLIYGGPALVLIAPLAAALVGLRLPPLAYYGAVGVFGLLVLAPFAMLAEASPGARYDRWAGAEVVRRPA